jgi:glycosyltransferase involved in cell wall biosynthesis
VNDVRDAEIDKQRQALAVQARQIEELTGRDALLNRILASRSWHLTRPLRFAGRVYRGEWSLVRAGLRSFFNSPSWTIVAAIRRSLGYFGLFPKAIAGVIRVLHREGLADIKVRLEIPVEELPGRSAADISDTNDDQLDLYQFDDVDFSPKISVIVPNFNHKEFIRERLEAIYNQTYKNIEVILLDDGSTDSSVHILKEYAGRYSDITKCSFKATNSGGVFKQWMKGVELATGELIWIAESDDYCTANFLEELVKPFSNQAVMLAFGRTDFVAGIPAVCSWTIEDYLADLDLSCFRRPFIKSAHWLVNNAWGIKNIIPNVSSALFRRPGHLDLFEDREWAALKLCGDWIFYLTMVRGGLVAYNPNVTNFYRQHPNNISVNSQKENLYYREHEIVAKHLVSLYKLAPDVLERQRKQLHQHWVGRRGESSDEGFRALYDIDRITEFSRNRKVNIIMATYALTTGGGEIFPVALANMLKARGYAITLFNCNYVITQPEVRKRLRKDIPLLQLDTSSVIAPVFRDFGIEIVHSHHFLSDVLLSTALAAYREIRQVVTLHGMYETMPPDDLKSQLPILGRQIESFVYVADKNLEPFPASFLRNKKLAKIPNAIEQSEINPIPRHEFGVGADHFVLCTASRAIPEMGWQEAIDAVKVANENSTRRIHLLLIGEGPERDRLASTTSLDYVHFVGFRSNVMDYFAASDLGFLPSRFHGESCPLVLIECLRAGKPMLASNIGEIAQMLRTDYGLAGATFDLDNWATPVEKLAELIINLANNRQLYGRMLACVPDAAAKFDPSKMVQAYEDVYRDAAANRDASTTIESFEDLYADAEESVRGRWRDKRCVLIIDQCVPEPDRDAGSRSMLHVLDALTDADFEVKFWPHYFGPPPQYTMHLQDMGVEVLRCNQFAGTYNSWVQEDYDTWAQESFDWWVRENGAKLDYVLLSRPNIAIQYIDALRKHSHAKLLFYGHDIHHVRLRLQAKVQNAGAKAEAEAADLEGLERRIWSMADVIYYPSDQETAYVMSASPCYSARTIPLLGFRSFAQPDDSDLSKRRDLLFVASFSHLPNEDAALWFSEQVFPLVRKRAPNVRLWLVGSKPTTRIRDLATDPSVVVTGAVSDEELTAHYAKARVAVVPLRYGAGLKGKVVEAMRFGVPIVTTSFGVQGMTELEATLPVHFEPAAFAEAVLTLLTDDASWRRQRRIQSDYVREHFSFEALRDFLLADVGSAKTNGREGGTRLPKRVASDWVLVADDFPPSQDQQDCGNRLRRLIDILGEQRWPMVFASRLTSSEFPGVLSTEAGLTRSQAALQKAGVKRFAYGLDEVERVMAVLGGNLRYAFLSRAQVARDLIPALRSHCPAATTIYDMVDFHTLRTASEAEWKHDNTLSAAAAELKAIEVAAVRASDITIAISTEQKAAVLDLVPTAVVEVLPDIFRAETVDAVRDKVVDLFHV